MSDSLDLTDAPSGYARWVLQQTPAHSEMLLRGTGLTRDELFHTESIRAGQQVTILANAMLLDGSPDWALKLARQFDVTSHGPVGFAAISASTLGDGLQVYADYLLARFRILHVNTTRKKNLLRLYMRPSRAFGALDIPIQELGVVVCDTYVLAAIGSVPRGVSINLGYPAPDYANDYARHLSLPYRFDMGETYLEVPHKICCLPCPYADQKLHLNAIAQCREALSGIQRPDDCASQVRNLLQPHFDQAELGRATSGSPSLEAVAELLSTSPRTLMRKLKLEGTNYREILEILRRDTARRLLKQAQYAVADIAGLLGYSDPANFARAFKRWTGQSPGQYRSGR